MKSHLPYKTARSVTQSSTAVYIASDWGVVVIDKEDESVDFLTKVEGLSEAGMGVIGYNSTADALLITYASSNIDLLKNGQIINLSDVKTLSKHPCRSVYQSSFFSWIICVYEYKLWFGRIGYE